MADCLDPHAMVRRYAEAADGLEEWHRGGAAGAPTAGAAAAPARGPRAARADAGPAPGGDRLLDCVHDPDGRPRDLRRSGGY